MEPGPHSSGEINGNVGTPATESESENGDALADSPQRSGNALAPKQLNQKT